MKALHYIITLFVGGLFILSGVIKLNDPVGTKIKMEEYFEVFKVDFSPFFEHLIPFALAFAVVMCVAEVVLGVALLVSYKKKTTLWSLLLLIVFFTFLTFYSAYFNKVTDCGCFGDAIKLTPWESFSKDIVLFVLILGLFITKPKDGTSSNPIPGIITLLAFALSSGFVFYTYQHLPVKDFRAYRIGMSLPEAMKPQEKPIYQYIMEKGGEKKTFDTYPKDTTWKFVQMITVNEEESKPLITDFSIWNDQGDFTQDVFEGIKLIVVVHNVTHTDKSGFGGINTLVSALEAEKIPTWVFTSASSGEFEMFRHEVQLAAPYYFGDATVLKTIVRSNPGILLLKDGTVLGKWHYNDCPTLDEIRALLK